MGEKKIRRSNKNKLDVLPTFLYRITSESWPNNGDKYYWVSTNTGEICKSTWLDGVDVCEFRKSIGNVFHTRFEAKEAISRQQAENEDRLAALK